MPEPYEIEQWIDRYERGVDMNDGPTKQRADIIREALKRDEKPAEFDDVRDWIVDHPILGGEGRLPDFEMGQVV